MGFKYFLSNPIVQIFRQEFFGGSTNIMYCNSHLFFFFIRGNLDVVEFFLILNKIKIVILHLHLQFTHIIGVNVHYNVG